MHDIWYALQDQHKYLYHYTSSNALASILAGGKFRFSRFEKVNDPRESKDWVFAYHYSTGNVEGIDFKLLDEKLNRSLKHEWHLACFVTDPYEALVTKERENAGEDIVEALYERGHSRPRMWATCGENYSGACLVFDKAILNVNVSTAAAIKRAIVYSGSVEYRNPRIALDTNKPDPLYISIDEIKQFGLVAAVQGHISRHWKELFFLKSRDWSQEREYRWLVSGKGNTEFTIDISKALVGIALGDRFPDTLKRVVGEYAESSQVSLASMNWKNGVPQPWPLHWRMLTTI